MMAFTVHTGGKRPDSQPPAAPPSRPAPPCTPEQIAQAERLLRLALDRRPDMLQMLNAAAMWMHAETPELQSLAALFTGKWRNDRPLSDLLCKWPTLRAPLRAAIGTLSLCHGDEDVHTVRNAVERLLPTLSPDQIAELAALLNRAAAGPRVTMSTTDASTARRRAIVEAVNYMDDAQLAALAPLAAAMINATPRRRRDLPAAVRRLLRHLFTVDDWMALAFSAIRHVRQGDE